MMAVVLGAMTTALGVWGLWIWRVQFLIFARGALPISLIIAGVMAVVAGLAGTKKRG